MSVTNIDQYVDYFRQHAARHKDLQHVPESETGDAAPGTKRFARWSADEVVSGLRSKVSFPALLLELYEVDITAENKYDIRQRPQGAFTILAHARPGDFADEQRAYSATQSIVYDILKQMWQDHHGEDAGACSTPFRSVEFNKMQITPVGPLFDNEFGWRVEFSFELQQAIDITVPPAEGVFIS